MPITALTLKGTNDTFAVTSTSFNLRLVLSPSDTSIFLTTENFAHRFRNKIVPFANPVPPFYFRNKKVTFRK